MTFYTNFPKYPTAIFNDTDYPTQAEDVDWVHDYLINALKEELQAVQTELGTLPKGSYANVKTRLDAPVGNMVYVIGLDSPASIGGTGILVNMGITANTYSKIINVAEGYIVGAANTAFEWDIEIQISAVIKAVVTVKAAATGTGDLFTIPWALSYAQEQQAGAACYLYARAITAGGSTAYCTGFRRYAKL